MAERQEPVTEVEDEDGSPDRKQSRRRRFGRRKEDPKEVRSDTEWVDTLVAHEGAEDEPLTGSPFAAGEEEPDEPETHGLPELPEDAGEHGGTGEFPQDAAEVGDEVVLKERQLYRPDKMSLENQVRAAHRHRGERDAFYEKSWTRRQSETMEDIHNYIDNVIGTSLDPSNRRERLNRAGLPPRRRSQGGQSAAESVHVEGLDEDLMIAFTFPKAEFRGARVVYETEGGYVVEVTRAVGGDEDRREVQYYTVSRVGEVAHVLDKMRAREAERRAREQGIEPIGHVAGPDPGTEPEEAPPAPEDVGAPGATDAEAAPEERPDASAEAQEPVAASEAATETTSPVPATQAPEADAGAEEAEGKKKGLGGLFKRGKGETDAEASADASPADAAAEEDDASEGKKKGFGGLFKRKKDDEGDDPEEPPQEGEGTTEEENQA